MQIQAGNFKGLRIVTPKGLATRPTSARVREACFNMLGEEIEGAEVLDLFAGSGSMGLEAASRGARSVIFIDQNRAASASIKKTLEVLRSRSDWQNSVGFQNSCTSVGSALKGFAKRHAQFDFVWLDPPYDENRWSELAAEIKKVSRSGGCCMIECSRRVAKEVAEQFAVFFGEPEKNKQYGDTSILLFRVADDN